MIDMIYDEIVFRVFRINIASVIAVKYKRVQTLLHFVTTLGQSHKIQYVKESDKTALPKCDIGSE